MSELIWTIVALLAFVLAMTWVTLHYASRPRTVYVVWDEEGEVDSVWSRRSLADGRLADNPDWSWTSVSVDGDE